MLITHHIIANDKNECRKFDGVLYISYNSNYFQKCGKNDFFILNKMF